MQELGEWSGARVEWPGKIFDPADLAEEYRSSLVFVYPSVADTGEALPVAPPGGDGSRLRADCFRSSLLS